MYGNRPTTLPNGQPQGNMPLTREQLNAGTRAAAFDFSKTPDQWNAAQRHRWNTASGTGLRDKYNNYQAMLARVRGSAPTSPAPGAVPDHIRNRSYTRGPVQPTQQQQNVMAGLGTTPNNPAPQRAKYPWRQTAGSVERNPALNAQVGPSSADPLSLLHNRMASEQSGFGPGQATPGWNYMQQVRNYWGQQPPSFQNQRGYWGQQPPSFQNHYGAPPPPQWGYNTSPPAWDYMRQQQQFNQRGRSVPSRANLVRQQQPGYLQQLRGGMRGPRQMAYTMGNPLLPQQTTQPSYRPPTSITRY